jgi:hypothetical protein
MKKILALILTIHVATGSMIFGNPSDHQMKVAKFPSSDLTNFIAAIAPIKASFLKRSETAERDIQRICKSLRDRRHPNLKLKKAALHNIKKTQADVDALKNIAISFQNSSDALVRQLSEEFITLHKHATAMLKHEERFVTAPRKFTHADGALLRKYTDMFRKQCERIDKLINEA